MSELFFLCIVNLPNCYSVSPLYSDYRFFIWEHLSRALPTEKIFYLLRSFPSEHIINHAHCAEFMLEIIIKWLQVSVSESNRRIP